MIKITKKKDLVDSKESARFSKKQTKISLPEELSPLSVKLNLLESAIALLNNNKKLCVEEKSMVFVADPKVAHDSAALLCLPRTTFDAPALAFAKSMLGQSTYKFSVSKTSTLVSGSGVFSINIATNLSVMSEGACLLALFDECKLLHTQIRLAPVTNSTQFAFGIGWYPSVDATTPTADAVSRLPLSRALSPYYTGEIVLNQKTVAGRNWGFTVDEGVSSPRIVSGMNGTWKTATIAGTPGNSITYYGYIMKQLVAFRART